MLADYAVEDGEEVVVLGKRLGRGWCPGGAAKGEEWRSWLVRKE